MQCSVYAGKYNQMADAPIRVLIIDDNELDRKFAVNTLKNSERSFSVEEADDGPEGIEAFKHGTFDCVILNFRMPTMKGPDVLDELLTLDHRVRVLAMSGLDDSKNVMDMVNQGAAGRIERDSLRQPDVLTNAILKAVQ